MKKFTFSILFILFGTLLHAQEDIRAEILSYPDSTEMIIRNGRKLVLDRVLAGDHKKAMSTINFLRNNTDKRYVIFYPSEELLLSLSVRNFSLFLYNAKNYEHLMEDKTKSVRVENIIGDLDQYLAAEMPFISEELEASQLNEKDKEIIRLYIRYYTGDNIPTLNKDIKNYQKSNPDSDYNYFSAQLKRLSNTGRTNFLFGYGNEFLGGEISEVFTNHIHLLNMELDVFINNLYLSMFIGGSISKVNSSIDLPVKNKELIHASDEKASSLKYGFKAGRKIYSGNNMNLYPFLSFGGYEINSQSSEFKEKDTTNPKNNLVGSFFTGVGAASDIVLKKWVSHSLYEPSALIFVRPEIGFDKMWSKKQYAGGSDFYFKVSVGFSLGSF